MKLSQLLNFNNIIVQCHNTPDADAIASGMALTKYLKDNGKNVCLVYGGNFEITKSNLKLMIADLGVDIHYVRHQVQLSHLLGLMEQELPDLLVTIDSQYEEGNIRKFKAKNIAIIDHHQVAKPLPEMSEVRSYLASCSTLIWDMLREEGISVQDDINLSTALYYGLMTDSNNFTEINHPLDMDMRDDLKYSSAEITKFRNSNISQEELRIAGIALLGSEYYRDNHYSIVKTDPCDPNILGIISDMLLEVEDVDCCLVYSVHEGGIKVSIRSCVKEVKADELAQFICEGVGNGGGHTIKAGGSIIRSLLEQQELDYNASSIQQFFRERMKDYFVNNEIIYADDYVADTSDMALYKNKEIILGYVKATDILPVGKKMIIRALAGDVDVTVAEDTYIVVGLRGEIYATTEKVFFQYYKITDGQYKYPADYEPTVRNHKNQDSKSLLQYVKTCLYVGNGNIYAREIKTRTKVFTRLSPDSYSLGRPGDFFIASGSDLSNVYILDREMFLSTYEKVVD